MSGEGPVPVGLLWLVTWVSSVVAVATARRWTATRQVRRRLGGSGDDRRGFVARAGVWRLPDPVREAILDFGLSASPEVLIASVGAGAAVGLLVAMIVGGAGTALVVLVTTVAVIAGAGLFGRGRAGRLVDRQLPGALDAVAGGLRSGSSLVQAMHDGCAVAFGPLRSDLDQVVGTLATGLPLPAALGAWRVRRPSAAVRATTTALTIAHEVGGGAARAIDGVAASLRDRAAVEREVAALSVQARASATVIVVAPLCFAALTGASDRASWQFLTGSPTGLTCLAAGLALDLAGGAWMAWLARSVS